ncbi:hypothetical protein EIP86_011024 [Pleurotus ostreatoroseus]|nr:hypothetical protein EIP86_011024 [Pleurotus ostreatoroseus]
MHTLRSPSQSSSVSYASTANLVPHDGKKAKSSFSQQLFDCGKRKRKLQDTEKNSLGASQSRPPNTHWLQGWKVIFLGSWLNILILLIPATWVLRLATPQSHTLIFCSCLLAMIPLVKIIALRKCELRVVQSSLIGSMLSKLLLILGMCFFAGGMRFTQQDLDNTATQIHSSLLSLSVGAVLLPAAFHFTLTYRSGENPGASLDEQKQDILRMSHGVSVVLILIYFSYILFQFWSHSHHFQDVQEPSNKLPNAVSVRSVTSRVRPSSPFRKITSPTPTYTTDFRSPRLTSPEIRKGPYTVYRTETTNFSPPRRDSPSPNTSQVTLAAPAPAAASTVRLVPEMEREDSISTSSSIHDGTWAQSQKNIQAGERASLVSDLVTSYLTEMGSPADREEFAANADHFRSRVTLVADPALRDREREREEKAKKRNPELSWFLTLVLLTVVTVLVAVNAEWMIDSIDGLSPTISKEWIGLILLPTVGSIAECITSINGSVKDQLTLSVSVAVGSTIQTALFVIP